MSTTQEIKRAAHEFGFDRVAIASAAPLQQDEAIFADRVERGLFDGMDWMTAERARRACRPAGHVPAARSVISLAMSYLRDQPIDLSREGEPHGQVSRYAWGSDYHGDLGHRTRRLCAFIEARYQVQAHPKACVDTVALAERAIARRAGLGWFGKNTMLLTSSHGSWVFLAEIITDLDLEPDSPLRTSCGACRRCMAGCPTGALDTAYELDARLCIAFLTIELRGAIPRHLRAKMGTWIFGCDVCQEVCPVNRKAAPGRQEQFEATGGIGPSPELLPLLNLGDAAFRERFRHSPVKRAKRAGLLRNVCVALGNAGDPAAIGPLGATLIADVAPVVRQHAAWALGRLADREGRTRLRSAYRTEPDDAVREEIDRALARDY